jgi:hypothetical protein
MSVKRNSPLLEAAESLNAYRATFQQKQQAKAKKALDEKAEIENQIYNGTKQKNARRKKAYSEFCESVKTDLLDSAIRGIYIGALQENAALTDSGMLLADTLVKNYIKESGGATAVLSKISGKTYALDYIKAVVEGTYESILEDTDEEAVADADEAGEEVETPEEKKSEMYDDLNKDEDINNAVNIIAQRITDAEQEFIKKNNEDKKALEDIAQKFSDRIKSVEEDPEAEPEDKEEVEQESSRLARRYSSDRRNNRTRNVFEQVVINLTETIVKNEDLMVQYTEDGKLDMGSVIESAKCIYGFLETVNTLQLQRVNATYIQEALSTM